jgi:hypothetical protein
MQTDEPAVLDWMLALAPRPQMRVSAPGHHWWRELVTDAWFMANHAWELEREAFANGHATEEREFEDLRPRPKLGDFMSHLSTGAWSAPEVFA